MTRSRAFYIWTATTLLLGILVGLALAAPADAHKGYHYAGLRGTGKNTHETWARMMIPHKPKGVKSGHHVTAWTILWDAGGTEQYAEVGIGYYPRQCKQVMLWWASPTHPYARKVACVPWGTWVDVSAQKFDGEDAVHLAWLWDGNEITKRVAVDGWLNGPGYHPAKAEITGKHPKNVTIYFDDVPTFEGDALYWHVEGPWTPEGTFADFAVRREE